MALGPPAQAATMIFTTFDTSESDGQLTLTASSSIVGVRNLPPTPVEAVERGLPIACRVRPAS